MATSTLQDGKESCKPLFAAPIEQYNPPEPTASSVSRTGSIWNKQRWISLVQLSAQVQNSMEAQLQIDETVRDSRISDVLQRHGVTAAAMPFTAFKDDNAVTHHRLHFEKQRAFSALLTQHGFSLEQVVELARGQTPEDPRPNKALSPNRLHRLLTGYQHRDLMCQAARLGLDPEWSSSDPDQQNIPPNHKSADRHLNTVVKSIRAGQDGGQYLVLNEDVLKQLNNIQISPLGAVPKAHTDPQLETRLIHDLSFPAGHSTNDASVKSSFPEIRYRHVAAVAQRIEDCYQNNHTVTVYIMKGDVKGAFRHLMLVARSVKWMGARIQQLGVVIIDMSAPFGWTGSPAYYGTFGRAISWLLGRESPATMAAHPSDSIPFFAYEWVDDHVLVEPDTPGRLKAACTALRLAMLAILGPRSINESKFSEWSTKLEVLGLEFDTIRRTVSMPASKLAKAQDRVQSAARKAKLSKHELQCLLGSLRHVTTCLRSAKPFYQRLQQATNKAARWQSISLDESMRQDLHWCEMILTHGRWWSLPTSMFCVDAEVDVHLYMDASNQGLAVLDPARRRYIQLRYDDSEQQLLAQGSGTDGFNINVREQFCMALATCIWGPMWRKAESSVLHVRCWTDNTSAAAWTNNMYSSNRFAQELNRAIGFSEVTLGFRISAEHLPGACNIGADAGSRAWTASHGSSPATRTLHLQNVLDELQARSLADDSRRKYSRTWKEWSEWCNSQGLSQWLEGTSDAISRQLALFAVSRWLPHNDQPGNAPSTVLSKLSQVSWYHRRYRGITVGLHAGHQLAVQGMLRVSRPPTQKEPVTPRILRQLRKQCNFNRPHDRVLWGAALMGYFFLLRRSEYLADKGRVKQYTLRYTDVVCLTKDGNQAQVEEEASSVRVKFRGSKTDQCGRGETRILERSGLWWACPVRASWLLRTHQRQNDIPSDQPLCSVAPGKTITATDMTRAIKQAAQAAGEESDRYGTHSMRSGGATALFTAGVDRLAIKRFGRWKSDAYERYTRIDGQVLTGLAANLISSNTSRP